MILQLNVDNAPKDGIVFGARGPPRFWKTLRCELAGRKIEALAELHWTWTRIRSQSQNLSLCACWCSLLLMLMLLLHEKQHWTCKRGNQVHHFLAFLLYFRSFLDFFSSVLAMSFDCFWPGSVPVRVQWPRFRLLSIWQEGLEQGVVEWPPSLRGNCRSLPPPPFHASTVALDCQAVRQLGNQWGRKLARLFLFRSFLPGFIQMYNQLYKAKMKFQQTDCPAALLIDIRRKKKTTTFGEQKSKFNLF